jgi:hypothetical protein
LALILLSGSNSIHSHNHLKRKLKMNKMIKIAALTGGMLAASVANAGIISVTHNATGADEANFIAMLNAGTVTTETFENLGNITCLDAGGLSTPCTSTADFVSAAVGFDTSVGTFTQTAADGTGSEPFGQLMQIQIEDGATGEFGREMPFSGNWLDSNDSDTIDWGIDAAAGINAFGFFLSDANDNGAVLELIFNNGTTYSVSLDANLGNGNLAYVTYVGDPSDATDTIVGATLVFDNGSNNNDGFGVDNVTIGQVSAPQALLLMSLSILGLIAARKRV